MCLQEAVNVLLLKIMFILHIFSFFLLVPGGFVTTVKHFHESLMHIECSLVR